MRGGMRDLESVVSHSDGQASGREECGVELLALDRVVDVDAHGLPHGSTGFGRNQRPKGQYSAARTGGAPRRRKSAWEGVFGLLDLPWTFFQASPVKWLATAKGSEAMLGERK